MFKNCYLELLYSNDGKEIFPRHERRCHEVTGEGKVPSLCKDSAEQNNSVMFCERKLGWVLFAKQTKMNLPSYRPNILTTSKKLDCLTFVRNDGKPQTVMGLPSYRSNVLATFQDSAIADRATLVRNDGKTTLVPQYLSALVPFKKAAFTKPSRGTSDSERRTIINGNRAAWLSAINGFLCFAQQNSNTLCRQSAFRFDCERCRLMRGAAFTLAEILITLGIIGVVAAMTIPSIIANYQKKVTVNQLKKAYSEIAQAVQLSRTQNEDISNWDFTLNGIDFYNKYLKNYFVKNKEVKNSEFRNQYTIYNLNGTECSTDV